MGVNKKEKFDRQEIELADFAKAFGHPARIAIMKALAQKNTCICGEIVKGLPLAQSTISQHLKELLKVGLITGAVDGVKSCYCINWNTFKKFSEEFNQFFDKTKTLFQNINCC